MIWAGIIFNLSSQALPQVTGTYWGDFTFKKFSHVFFYAVFGALTYRALVGEGIKKQKAFIAAIILTCLYGVSDEIHQSLVPGREPRVRDVVFDSLGGIMGAYFVKMKKP